MRMTIREAIKQMRKLSVNVVTLNNGTRIRILEMNTDMTCPIERDSLVGSIKIRNGEMIIRKFYCTIYYSAKSEMRYIDKYITDRYVGDYFPPFSCAVIPEKEMNEFINDNGGIDIYQTISEPGYFLCDTIDRD